MACLLIHRVLYGVDSFLHSVCLVASCRAIHFVDGLEVLCPVCGQVERLRFYRPEDLYGGARKGHTVTAAFYNAHHGLLQDDRQDDG